MIIVMSSLTWIAKPIRGMSQIYLVKVAQSPDTAGPVESVGRVGVGVVGPSDAIRMWEPLSVVVIVVNASSAGCSE